MRCGRVGCRTDHLDKREVVRCELEDAPGVERSATVRASNYPRRNGFHVSTDVLARVARALAEAGWPAVRHVEDYQRLAAALSWFASGRRGAR